jgi:hypothetical protein
MASRTESAILGLVAALAAKATAAPTVLVAPRRNDAIGNRFAAFNGSTGGYLNVVDGTGGPEGANGNSGEFLGADQMEDGDLEAYELVQRPEIEWLVDDADETTRETAFDAGLIAINDAIKVDRTLNGTVAHAGIEKIDRSNLITDGLSTVKACIITVALSFTSPHPF